MSESPFVPFGDFVVLLPIEIPVEVPKDDDSSPEKKSDESPDGRARNPWAKVLAVGPGVENVEVGQIVYFFYAEEVSAPGKTEKLLIARESDLYVALT